jgi:hypothetical protein
MIDRNQLLKTGRQLLRESPALTEAEFRNLMLERFREDDQGLKRDQTNMTGGPADPVGGVLSGFVLPWIFIRWLGWRGRLARHHADMDEVVQTLRQEGKFAARPT